jgi:hypothetical protein
MTHQHRDIHIKLCRRFQRWKRVWWEKKQKPIPEVIAFLKYVEEYDLLIEQWKHGRKLDTLTTGRNFPVGLEDAIRSRFREWHDLEYLHELTALE